MSMDDIIYLACLLSCIGFGPYYRSIKDETKKKLIGTSFGILIVFIVSGSSFLYILTSFLICAGIIAKARKDQCHIISFIFMFSYLLFFRTAHYFGLPEPTGHANMIQMILTLKLVGLSFEVNTNYNKLIQYNKDLQEKKVKAVDLKDYDQELISLDFIEIFHYSFNYIGVLIGPYYRYRTFRDYFETPFQNYANCYGVMIDKFIWTSVYCIIFLVFSYIWPLEYALSDEFYEERSFLYRLFYIWPTFIIFRMRIYTGLTLSECVCINAGFGAYPDDSNVANGEGPKDQYLHFKRNPDKLTYNFKTIQNIDVYGTETCWTFREAMKTWNICVQYWLAVNVYKRFPSKKYRTLVTLLVSAFWHGLYPGHYFCIMGAPFYVPIENIYNTLYRKDSIGLKRKIIDILFWISKFFAFSYLGISFQLLTIGKIWSYYNSVYHFGYIYFAVLFGIGTFLLKQHKIAERRNQKLGISAPKDHIKAQ